MRVFVLGVVLVASWASAETLKGRVLFDEAPVAKAQVRIFAAKGEVDGCPRDPARPFGRCLCPDLQEDFGKRLRAGLEGPKPIATTVTAADGTYSVSVTGEGPFTALVMSADGKRGGQMVASAAGGDLGLFDTGKLLRVRVEGITQDAEAWLFDPETMVMERLVKKGDMFSGPSTQFAMRELVVAAPGAQTRSVAVIGDRAAFMPQTFAQRNSSEPWSLRLDAPATMGGRVVDEKFRPVAGAEVVVDPDHCAVRVLTDATGGFRVAAVHAAPSMAFVEARSKGRIARGNLDLAGFTELRLQVPSQLELTFTDAQKNPVEGVEGNLVGEGVGSARVKSDAAGKWSRELPETSVTLRLTRGWMLLTDRVIAVKGVVKKTLVVVKGVALKGRVLDAKGKPTRGARISVAFSESAMKGATEAMKESLNDHGDHSDLKGAFSLMLAAGEYEVVANAGEPDEASRVVMVPGPDVELQLPEAAKVEGQVVDLAGKPVPNVVVSVAHKDVPSRTWSWRTTADGKFSVKVAGPGIYKVQTASQPAQLAEVGIGTGKPLTFKVETPKTIKGRVQDAAGKPLAGVRVESLAASLPQLTLARMKAQPMPEPASLVAIGRVVNMYAAVESEADGSFELPWTSDALVFVDGVGQGSVPAFVGPNAAAVVEVLPRSRVRGRVVDAQGRPVSRFKLGEELVIDGEGWFEKTLPASGTLRLTIAAPPSPLEIRTVEVPAEPTVVRLADIRLRPGFAVSGVVTAGDTGKPMSTQVEVKSLGGEVASPHIQNDGAFTIRGVPAGKVTLVFASRNGYAATTVEANAGDRELKVKMPRFASLVVTVRQKGQPVRGMRTEVSQGKQLQIAATTPDGEARFESLPPGEWSVQLVPRQPSLPAPPRIVKLAAGQPGKLVLDLK